MSAISVCGKMLLPAVAVALGGADRGRRTLDPRNATINPIKLPGGENLTELIAAVLEIGDGWDGNVTAAGRTVPLADAISEPYRPPPDPPVASHRRLQS